MITPVLPLLFAVLLACFLAWRLRGKTKEIDRLKAEKSQQELALRTLELTLEKDQALYGEKLKALEQTQSKIKEIFDLTSAQALERNNRSFLQLAKQTLAQFHEQSKGDLAQKEQAIAHLVQPIKLSLGLVDQKLQELEKNREGAYQVLRHQVTDMIQAQKELRLETANLVKALRVPHVRGRWGEMQLKRVVEMSGMSSHCDFIEQESLEGEEGKLRPDMVVKLPGGKQIIIDAKAPLGAYLDAMETNDEAQRTVLLGDHARQVRKHIMALAKREYWDHVSQAEVPEFVVLFLPGEPFFSAALSQDPSLIEVGVENRVILATPTTLIALLHAVAYGWRQETLSQNAHQISELGKEIYKRLSDMSKHFSKLGGDLSAAVSSYNKTLGTFERRVLSSARRFKELDTSPLQVDLTPLQDIDTVARSLTAPELSEGEIGG
jgi:DNA recombination protein RmuC